jgi:sugar phosphate isomerase/epimerase
MHKLSGHLQMVHASDNSGKFDDHRPPGTGSINWTRLLSELSLTGFHGGIILELANNDDVQGLLASARKARSYLREISRRLALSSPPTVATANKYRVGRPD